MNHYPTVNSNGEHVCDDYFDSGTPELALAVRRELESIAYGHVGATRQERIIAGFLLSEVSDGLNYRIVPTTYSGNGTGSRK